VQKIAAVKLKAKYMSHHFYHAMLRSRAPLCDCMSYVRPSIRPSDCLSVRNA